MARNKDKYLTTAIRAPFFKRFGLGSDATKVDHDFDNEYAETWADATDGSSIEALRVDADGNVRLGEEALNPQDKTVVFSLAANGSLGTQAFFIADRQYRVISITEIHKTAGTNAGAVSISVTHETGTQAPGTGTALQSAVFNAKATANTLQTATLAATPGNDPNGTLVLNTGDRLSVLFAGTLTTLAGVTVTVAMSPAGKSHVVYYYVNANADLSSQTFYINHRDMVVTGVQLIYSTAFAAGTTITVTKDTSTNAPGAGTALLSAAMAADGAINTVINGALVATAATLRLTGTDRLAIKYSATTTGAGVVLAVNMMPLYGEKTVCWQVGPAAQQAVTQNFFIADRDYEVIDAYYTSAVAAGGAQVITVTIDRGTTAPGGGTAIDATGFNGNATANTPQTGDSSNQALTGLRRNRIMMQGDRLGLSFTGAAQSSTNTCITVVLVPR